MPQLQLLRSDHASAVWAFEVANRAFFASVISDRGDAYFDHFSDRLNDLLAEQEAGLGAFYVLVDEEPAAGPAVLGRFNLIFESSDTARLGYRVAQHLCGRGVATATVLELCHLAAARHGMRTLRAATSLSNAASRRVLVKAGFVAVGPAEPKALGGKSGTWFRDLTADEHHSAE